ncbi:MAG: hypothetical protein ACI9S8_000129 [Chlamydiales bacterium]|jgi:hypothetical protein
MTKRIFVLVLASAMFMLSNQDLKASENLSSQSSEFFEGGVAKVTQKSTTCSFTPPRDWKIVPRNTLPTEAQSDYIKIHVKGEGGHFPPSINLAIQATDLDLRSYMQESMMEHESHVDSTCKKLGSIQTASGPASLMQIDRLTGWGNVRLLQSFVQHKGSVYVITGTALQEDFPQYYKEFFEAIQSLKIDDGLFTSINDPTLRNKIELAYMDMKDGWHTTFSSTEVENSGLSRHYLAEKTFDTHIFQNKFWVPFTSILTEDLSDMNPEWHDNVISTLKGELLWVR